jgi:hypothetical protein
MQSTKGWRLKATDPHIMHIGSAVAPSGSCRLDCDRDHHGNPIVYKQPRKPKAATKRTTKGSARKCRKR